MLLFILSILDLIAGLLVILSQNFLLTSNAFVFYFAIYSLGKGIVSLLTSIAVGYFFDWMGVIDVITGIALFMIHSGSQLGIFKTIGIIILIKGLYSLILSYASMRG